LHHKLPTMKNKIQQLTIILIILKQVFSSGSEIVKYKVEFRFMYDLL